MFPFCWACSEAGEIAIDLVLTQLKWFNDRSIDLWEILQKFQIVFDQGKFWHCLHCVSLQWLVNNTNTTRATQTTLVWLCRFGISISIIIKALLHNRVLFTNFSPQLQLWLFSSSMSQHAHRERRVADLSVDCNSSWAKRLARGSLWNTRRMRNQCALLLSSGCDLFWTSMSISISMLLIFSFQNIIAGTLAHAQLSSMTHRVFCWPSQNGLAKILRVCVCGAGVCASVRVSRIWSA